MSNIKIRQSCRPQGKFKNYWTWTMWLSGTPRDLDQIEMVEYLLHPSYPNRRRVSRSRTNGFRIQSNGWGEFKVIVTITFDSGKSERREHWLRLGSDDRDPERGLRSVFLSFAAADQTVANAIRDAFDKRGVAVVSAEQMAPGMPWQDAMHMYLAGADALVAVIPESGSEWMYFEVAVARSSQKPVIPIALAGRLPKSSDAFSGIQWITLTDRKDASKVVDTLISQFRNVVSHDTAREAQ